MEVAWNDNNQLTDTEGAEVLMELDEIVTATEKRVVGGVLKTSKQIFKEKLAMPFPEFQIRGLTHPLDACTHTRQPYRQAPQEAGDKANLKDEVLEAAAMALAEANERAEADAEAAR